MRAAVALVGLALVCVSPAPAAMGAAGGSEPAVAAFGGLLQLQLGSSVEDRLFTPELIFSYRTEIGLEWEQQAKIVELITEVQPELVPLQLELLGQTTALLRSIDQEGIGLDEAALRAEKIFSLEQRVKLEHLKLLLRIRNLLRPEQQAKLQALRAAARK